MIRFLVLALTTALTTALSFAAGARAQTVYKCSVDGKITYAERPCERGASVALPPAPVGVDPNVDAVRGGESRTLLETEKLADKLRAQREREERRAGRVQVRVEKADAARRKHCDRLRLRVKWAEEDLAHASLRKQDAARTRLRRRQEALAVECRP